MAVSEAWRDVPGYGGKYQASDMGRIANVFWRGRKRKDGGRDIMTQYKKKPCGKARESAKRFVHLTNLEGHRKEISAAKIVAETFLGPVLKFSAAGELLECYSSARQAAKANYFSYKTIIDRCNGKCKRHVLAPDGNYYAWDNTVSINRARRDLRALARQEGRIFAPANWPWPST